MISVGLSIGPRLNILLLTGTPWRTQTYREWGGLWEGADGERVECEPMTGSGSGASSGVQGQSSRSGGQGGFAF